MPFFYVFSFSNLQSPTGIISVFFSFFFLLEFLFDIDFGSYFVETFWLYIGSIQGLHKKKHFLFKNKSSRLVAEK